MLLSDADLRKELESGRLALDPWDPAMLQPSSIDVRLDRYFRVFQNSRYTHIDPMEQQDELTTQVEPAGDDPFVLHPGEFVLGSTFEAVSLPDDLAGRLEGKALAIGTAVPTVAGWRTMGSLRVGDVVFGIDGQPTPVIAATEIMWGRPCFEVCFSDGQTIVADAGHLWRTTTKSARKHGRPDQVVTTAEIAATLRVGQEWNHHVPLAGAARYPEQSLPIDPYVLGVRLGDGTSSKAEITVGRGDDGRMRDERGRFVADSSPSSTLRRRGLLDNKLIPLQYLRAAEHQRLALLQGLMDSDGYVDEYGRCEFVSIRECLADGVVELAASLGLRPTNRKKTVSSQGVEHGVAHQVKFTPRIPVFRLRRKLARLRTGREHRHRAITAVRPVSSYPVRCIQVAAPDGMFLVGRTYIPTHNSSLGRLGLLTHSTAGFIDPGFTGHITSGRTGARGSGRATRGSAGRRRRARTSTSTASTRGVAMAARPAVTAGSLGRRWTCRRHRTESRGYRPCSLPIRRGGTSPRRARSGRAPARRLRNPSPTPRPRGAG